MEEDNVVQERDERLSKRIRAAMEKASELLVAAGADTHQIVATYMTENDHTALAHRGEGNFYARRGAIMGLVSHWENTDIAEAIDNAREGGDED